MREDHEKTTDELIEELREARRRITELESGAAESTTTRQLVEVTQRLTNVLNTTPDLVFVKDLELRTVLCSEVFARAVGKTPAQMIGNTDIENGWDPELVRGNPEKGIRGFVNDDLRVLAGHSMHMPCEPANVGAELRYFDTFKVPLRDAQGKITGVLGISRDVTERKRAEDAGRAALEQLTATLNALPDIMFDVDEEGRIYDYHAPELGMLAVSPSRFLGKKVGEVLPPDVVEVIMLALAEAGTVGLHRGATYSLENTGGEMRWHELSVTLRKGETAPKRFVVLVRDVTERKRAEQALLDADRSKDEFLALLGHELRNPLAPIRNAVHVLALQEDLPAHVQWAADMINRQSAHLERLVGDLLDVARIISGRVNLELSAVTIRDALENAVQTVASLLDSRRQNLTIDTGSEAILVTADPVRLSQVFANLLHNAVKYTPEGGHIDVRVERKGESVFVRVRDDGVGIQPADIPRIFQSFFRAELDSTRIGEHDGLGLGLSLTKQLVERHGGSVSCHSDGPGHGTEFVVVLPCRPPAEASDSSAKSIANVSGMPRRRRILVVDDNPDVAESFKVLLDAMGHTTRTAESGVEALVALREWKPDVVFLDIAMPGMDGYQVASEIRSAGLQPQPLVVALTGYSQDTFETSASREAFDRYLLKPADPIQIEAVLDDLP